jgi:hypothetical protein
MADFQTDVLDHIARIVGGTVSSHDPHFFSGVQVGDGTGVANLQGCYSSSPATIDVLPIGVLISDDFSAELDATGFEENEDSVRLLLLVATDDFESRLAELNAFRDAVPSAFRAHMQAFNSPGAVDCFITGGRTGVHIYGGTDYLAWEFTVRVRRGIGVQYTP